MMYVEASTDGLPVIVAKLKGAAVYLDNWAIIELANGDVKRRERFVKALRSCGSRRTTFLVPPINLARSRKPSAVSP
jgi:hypothetical protein